MVTLVIPTINRSDFIIKYLTYLKNNQFECQVLIGDSSNEEHYEKVYEEMTKQPVITQ